jgi:HAE1 family hydrophobic/amphiphilic exporter-1
MVFLALMVIGYIATTRMPLSLLPAGNEERWLGVRVSYRNAAPAEVEQEIARPMEEILRTIGGVDRIFTSSSQGGCFASVRFRQSVDISEAYNRLRDRIDRLAAELPEGVTDIRVMKRNDEAMPVLIMSFPVSDEYPDLYALVEEQILRPIEQIDGVARSEIWGARPARAEIEIVQERANAHDINIYSIVRQLQRDNFSLSSGWIREGAQKLFVRSDSRFTTLEEIENLPIEGYPGLRIRDIANVTYGPRERRWVQRIDGARSVTVSVYKESMANTVEVTDKVFDLVQNDLIHRPQLDGINTVHFVFNQGNNIKASLDQLASTGMWGGIFALFVLFFFLRRVRMTFFIICAIPLSVFVSLGMMYFMDWSLNVVTMMGLIIGVGMVVDNSIVVVEAIYARRLEGEDSFHAALHGASEVGLAITVSTLTTIVVFLPLIFMSEDVQMSFYMARIGLPVVFALIGSLMVALLFIPLATSRLMSGKQPKTPRSIALATTLYRRALRWTMTSRLEAVAIVGLVFWSVTIPASKVASSFNMHGDFTPEIFVHFNMPDHYTPEQTDSIVAKYEEFMNTRREAYGIRFVEGAHWHGGGRIRAHIQPDNRSWYTIAWHNFTKAIGRPAYHRLEGEAAFADFRENAPRFAGVEMSVDRSRRGSRQAAVTLFGDDTRRLITLAEEVERRLRLLPELTDVNSDMEEGEQELQISVNRERAQQYGLDGRVIASTLSYALRGLPLRAYRTDDREVDLRVRLREEDRQTLDQVLNMKVLTGTGTQIAVGTLVDVEVGRGLERIRRENGRTRVRVSAVSSEQDLKTLADLIQTTLADFNMPPGYQWSLSGQFEQLDQQESNFQSAMIMAGLFVFLLMGILFESFILPFSVIMAIPFSFLGVYWMLWITDTPFDMMAKIGTIVLIGVVVNNAIVLVDLINRLRAEGNERTAAILEAGGNRFRPILMTSITTSFCLIPMSLSGGAMAGIEYASMGRAMIGGLLTATMLTLFVVPLFYSLFDDLRVYAARLVSLLRHPGVRKPAEATVQSEQA